MSVKKRIILIFSLLVTVMLVVPIVLLNTVKPDAQLAYVLLLFYAVNPVICALVGAISAKDIKHFWYTPVAVPLFFWLFSSITYRTNFTFAYFVPYFAICLVSMLVTLLVNIIIKNINREK